VVEEIAKQHGVKHCEYYDYMCSDPGQKKIEDAITENNLEGIVVACCSPTLHEETFRNAAKSAGLNTHAVEIANIREQCSWVHKDRDKATEKAKKIIKGALQKADMNEDLTPIKVPVTKKCLVVGAGISGIQAALDIADSGYDVFLVEKSATIGGHMAQLSETFPTLDCSQCILTPKMVAVSRHPKVHLMTYSEVVDVKGYVGNFQVKIRKNPRYVTDDCNLCGDCVNVCPQVTVNEFDRGLTLRRAIYIPFPQAVPAQYVLDEESCLGLNPLRCDKCQRVCDVGAIDYDMQPEIVEESVGSIVVATGFDLYPIENIPEYGYDKYEDVIDGLQFERLLSASGPTKGKVRRPSDGKVPKEVVFIKCVGSRDPESHMPYCSKICCMYTGKHAMLYKHNVHDGQAYVFYMDIRSAGKDYEEFIQRATEEDKVMYIRGRVSKIFREGEKIIVWGVDTLSGKKVEIAADMVVLATAIVPREETIELAKILRIPMGPNNFLKEAHPKLRPVETLSAGIYLAGAAQAPKDIPETVAQGSGASAKVAALLSSDELSHDPAVVSINSVKCNGCGICVGICPYEALSLDTEEGVAVVNEVLCEGCGTCAAACPSGAAQLRNLTDAQIAKMLKEIL
jgi:heterodisulfide reductase subunit A